MRPNPRSFRAASAAKLSTMIGLAAQYRGPARPGHEAVRTGRRCCGLFLLILGCLALPGLARAQVDACTLVPDSHSPTDKILRCGSSLTVQPAPGTVYRATATAKGVPPSVQVDSGAVLVEFHATSRRHTFEILTPLAVAAVRGTKWAVEVSPERTSTLVLDGTVKVRRPNEAAAVVLRQGDGVDVTAAAGPLTVKQWGAERVKALLARFGQ